MSSELLIVWRDAIDGHYRRAGAIVVDASRTTSVVVDDILRGLEP